MLFVKLHPFLHRFFNRPQLITIPHPLCVLANCGRSFEKRGLLAQLPDETPAHDGQPPHGLLQEVRDHLGHDLLKHGGRRLLPQLRSQVRQFLRKV